jgi:endonuclease-3
MAKEKAPKYDKEEAARRVKKILPILKKRFPNARTELDYRTPLQLLISTILSAQCTDVRVNIVTKDLFKKYKSAKDFADVDLAQLEEDIKPTGFYRNKAKSIKAACRVITEQFGGDLPDNIEQLTTLPGVGRKTANVILSNAFGVPAISCDTHVIRLSRRLALSANSDPVKLEFDLAEITPKKDWSDLSHTLILLGRNFCKARRPDCDNCPINLYCPAAGKCELW